VLMVALNPTHSLQLPGKNWGCPKPGVPESPFPNFGVYGNPEEYGRQAVPIRPSRVERLGRRGGLHGAEG